MMTMARNLLLLFMLASPVAAQTPVYFYLPQPLANVYPDPSTGLFPLTAISTTPRVDFYAGATLIGSSSQPVTPIGTPPVPKGSSYFTVQWHPTVSAAYTLHAYACASLTACTGKSRLADSVLYNVVPHLPPATALRQKRIGDGYPHLPELEPKPGPK